MATSDRRGLFKLAAGSAAALAVGRIAGTGSAMAETPPPLPCLELTHKKKMIKICPPGLIKNGFLPDAMEIDGVPLKAMAHHGRFTSVLNQHVDFGSLRQAAEHAVDLLGEAKLQNVHARGAMKPDCPKGYGPKRERVGQVRKSAAALSATERTDLVNALLTLKSRGTYDWFVDVHMRAFDNTQWHAHMHAGFFTWHRAFLILFEAQLDRIKAGLALPYWDWSLQQTSGSAPFTNDFLGPNGSGQDAQVMDGPFAYRNGQWPINVRNDSRTFLRRELGLRADRPSGPSVVSAALAQTVYDRAPYDSSVTSFRNSVEGWPSGPTMHNRAHVWVGGSMLPASSPNDPAFFMNHCFVDKIWADWQARYPNAAHFVPTELLDTPIEPFKAEIGWSITPRQVLSYRSWYTYA